MRSFFYVITATHAGIGNTFLRIITGVVFMAHGSQKLFGLFGGGGVTQVIMGFEKLGMPYPEISAWLVSCTEFFGVCVPFSEVQEK